MGNRSRAWRGHTHGYALARAYVLARDNYQCQLNYPGCLKVAPLRAQGGYPAGQAHHTRDRLIVGDNPEYMVAACRKCNRYVGDPTTFNPQPIQRTDWSKPHD